MRRLRARDEGGMRPRLPIILLTARGARAPARDRARGRAPAEHRLVTRRLRPSAYAGIRRLTVVAARHAV
jgi:hypothetical protein